MSAADPARRIGDPRHVRDRHGHIWRVVRDGGMLTRADDQGIITIGIAAARRDVGPLVDLDVAQPEQPQVVAAVVRNARGEQIGPVHHTLALAEDSAQAGRELERLSGTGDTRTVVPLVSLPDALVYARAQADAEQGQIVRWLRDDDVIIEVALGGAAYVRDAIERGEHRVSLEEGT